METFHTFSVGDTASYDIEEKLSESGRISLTDIVAATIGTLDSENTTSSVDFLIHADNERHTVNDTSNISTASFTVRDQSKMLLQLDTSHDSFCSSNDDKSSRLMDDSVMTKQNEYCDSHLEEACAFSDSDDVLDHLVTAKETEQTPSTVINRSSLDSASTTPICESRHNTSLTGLLYSPSDSGLLNHPLFKDLQVTLLDECKVDTFPKSLVDMCTPESKMDVYARERALQRKFGNLQEFYPQETDQLSGFFRYQFILIETERFKVLHESEYSCSYRDSINSRFDSYLHKIMDRVEKSVKLLDEAANGRNSKRYMPYVPRQRPILSRRSVKIMEEWYARNYEHPYPNNIAVEAIAKTGGITNEQVKKWFANKRNRCKNTRTVPVTELN